MVTEISVHLPNIPGQFSRVLKALDGAQVSVRGFSIDQAEALSQLRLLFSGATEAGKAKKALVEYHYEPIPAELLLLSCPDAPGELLRITAILAENDINVDYGYFILGQAKTGEVLLALKVADGQAELALKCLAAYEVKEPRTGKGHA